MFVFTTELPPSLSLNDRNAKVLRKCSLSQGQLSTCLGLKLSGRCDLYLGKAHGVNRLLISDAYQKTAESFVPNRRLSDARYFVYRFQGLDNYGKPQEWKAISQLPTA